MPLHARQTLPETEATNMISRQNMIMKSALIGGVFGGAVGYIFCDERVYSIIPDYLSHSARESVEKFGERITSRCHDMADKVPLVGSFVSKTLTVSNPILTSITYKVTDVVIHAAKKSMMKACAKALQPYKVVPIMCLVGMTFGAGVGALTEWMCASDDDQPTANMTPPLSERQQFKLSMLQSQSLFNRRMAKSVNHARTTVAHAAKANKKVPTLTLIFC